MQQLVRGGMNCRSSGLGRTTASRLLGAKTSSYIAAGKDFPLFLPTEAIFFTVLIFWKQLLNRGRFETVPPDESMCDLLFGGQTCS
jgi:hypothetical protein